MESLRQTVAAASQLSPVETAIVVTICATLALVYNTLTRFVRGRLRRARLQRWPRGAVRDGNNVNG